MNTSWLVLFRETVAAVVRINAKRMHSLCGQNAEFLLLS